MLTLHPTWEIQDPSKISTYQNCPRKYFYEYVLGWRPITPSIDLVFGHAWHLAMEQLLTNGYNDDSLRLAYVKLLDHYRESFDPVMDDSYHPKTPGFAATMLDRYMRKYADDFDKFEVCHTEVSGAVSITQNRQVHFKMDNILRWKTGPRAGKYFSLEHKTTKTIKSAWHESHTLTMQPFLYTHVLRCLYGDDTDCVIFNVAQFQKTNPDFFRLQTPKTVDQLSAWIHEIKHYLYCLEDDYDFLSESSDKDQTLDCFLRNGEACTKYMRVCKYFDFCTSWANPLKHAYEPPLGFKVEFWDPRDEESKTGTKVQL